MYIVYTFLLLKIIISVYLFYNNLKSAITRENFRLNFLNRYQHGTDVSKVIISLGYNNYFFSRYC